MAVPSSGTLSLLGLAREKQNDDYTNTTVLVGQQGNSPGAISLESCATSGNNHGPQVVMEATNTGSSSYPNSSTPHSMSEWYSYDHDAVVLVSKSVYTTSVPKGVFACGQSTNGTWYFPDQSPAVNDQVYTASNGTSPPSAGKYGYKNIGSGSTDYRFEVNSSGVITSVNSC
jgi:hypothetical protein